MQTLQIDGAKCIVDLQLTDRDSYCAEHDRK